MKKRIGSRMYDTETAKLIAKRWTRGLHPGSDFRWMRETLFQKKTGEFFIFGAGGPMSEYARECSDGSWTSGCGFRLLGSEHVQLWLEWAGDRRDYPLLPETIGAGCAGLYLDEE